MSDFDWDDYFNIADLLRMGWSRPAIDRILGKPDTTGPGLMRNSVQSLYLEDRVYQAIEVDRDFSWAKRSLRSKLRQEAFPFHKRYPKTAALVDKIRVERIDRRGAIEHTRAKRRRCVNGGWRAMEKVD